MKITFEGQDIADIVDQIKNFVDDGLQMRHAKQQASGPATLPPEAFKALVNKPVDKPVVERPLVHMEVTKPFKKERTEKQLANDERMRVAALARIAARKAAKAAPVEKPVEKLVEKMVEKPVEEPPELFADPAEIVQLRTRTIEELQVAYADGHHKEVLELLSRFGNGAKSFRELPPESFVPIRQAIDNGALT